jgi:hypothetical protein
MLSDAKTQEAFVKSLTRKATPVEKVQPTLRRRVGYIEEEVSVTCTKLAEMELSKNMETSKERGKDNDEPVENTQIFAS